MPTFEDLAIDTIDNALGIGNDSESQTTTSFEIINNNDVETNIFSLIGITVFS
jgi:hypothetical protein